MTGAHLLQKILLKISPGYRRQTYTMHLVRELVEATHAQTRLLSQALDMTSNLDMTMNTVLEEQAALRLLLEASIDVQTFPASRGPLRDMQTLSLLILKELDRICTAHGLRYWLDFGTLLGAARHEGFIPWDDDLDVGMPVDDYRRLLDVIDDELASTDFAFLKVPSQIGKLIHREFAPDGDQETAQFISWSLTGKVCFAVDIFPYYNLAESTDDDHAHRVIVDTVNESAALLDHAAASEAFEPASRIIAAGNQHISQAGASSRLFLGAETRAAQPRLIDAEDVFPLTHIDFEGSAFPAPRRYESYLIDLYGDFMEVPRAPQPHLHWDTIPKEELRRLREAALRS